MLFSSGQFENDMLDKSVIECGPSSGWSQVSCKFIRNNTMHMFQAKLLHLIFSDRSDAFWYWFSTWIGTCITPCIIRQWCLPMAKRHYGNGLVPHQSLLMYFSPSVACYWPTIFCATRIKSKRFKQMTFGIIWNYLESNYYIVTWGTYRFSFTFFLRPFL